MEIHTLERGIPDVAHARDLALIDRTALAVNISFNSTHEPSQVHMADAPQSPDYPTTMRRSQIAGVPARVYALHKLRGLGSTDMPGGCLPGEPVLPRSDLRTPVNFPRVDSAGVGTVVVLNVQQRSAVFTGPRCGTSSTYGPTVILVSEPGMCVPGRPPSPSNAVHDRLGLRILISCLMMLSNVGSTLESRSSPTMPGLRARSCSWLFRSRVASHLQQELLSVSSSSVSNRSGPRIQWAGIRLDCPGNSCANGAREEVPRLGGERVDVRAHRGFFPVLPCRHTSMLSPLNHAMKCQLSAPRSAPLASTGSLPPFP
ncbi:hypothetical protein OH76DRAFT_333982 [Lentinus brumalis]|uniref:Uncharacterized protein n=1 Tax=Lentinus brumalis TaxID=2498619 RepID=A0A371CJU8_9APHY|nr:hypothetical protein OH76DRAFT_333982 [Polyporus brumalis]